ncbi:DNA mismatch repair protein MutT [Rhodococcus sp. WMMA185]|uniref:(deoxy)nucleoside triphosphate pyrophosphohydrolase n=1 Tax=Rhodococcus sp. WMMA185 TaxID=679318 RepID=UPI0008788023|nr:NUDIX domain-containing protein [Rhodococcus sp. WMMA185]AOW91956.1 DNA mismatch repair protein MutT [Rhodococcus sp. WMMA185]
MSAQRARPDLEAAEVVAAAIIVDGRLLLAQRTRPPELAGLWELPGGKAEAGEAARDALRREMREELGVEVSVGERIGEDVPLPDGRVLRAYRVKLISGTPTALDHAALRWVDARELGGIDLVGNDRGWVPHLVRHLAGSS